MKKHRFFFNPAKRKKKMSACNSSVIEKTFDDHVPCGYRSIDKTGLTRSEKEKEKKEEAERRTALPKESKAKEAEITVLSTNL